MREISKLDLTMIEEVKKFVDRVQNNGGKVILSGVSNEIYRVLKNYNMIEKIGKDNIFQKQLDIFSSTKEAIKKAEDESK
jgi:SulP family sulfate permease